MKTSQILKLMKVLSWIIFIGLCIKAGAILISFIVSIFINQEATKKIYLGLDLSNLYNFSSNYYITLVVLLLIAIIMKALIFYLVIKLFYKFNENTPFNESIANLIHKISYATLLSGFIAVIGTAFCKWLKQQNILINFNWSAEELFFMAGIIFIISLFYKRGLEIQSENDLTI